ncbi:hypothetical protein [Chryseobacterium sp. ERMR1:04]|uniref:hypothetical protein n=1 Tax=Chryseobacterium sp. ERMR1:04 TaxID=1705393 RepID=UPI0006C8E4E9|nr:hypothetical protein [Chryseobacterium sp. ERMR1:04]KPH14112.1 hypothetical protein AMQ68_00880 [Chryseobacterium sp. ERMR1:04]
MKTIKVNTIILCTLWLFFLNCEKKQDIIDDSFSNKYKTNKTSLVINSNNKNNETYMTGIFKYFSNNYSINHQLYIKDSVYYYDKNKILFDFSSNKKSGSFDLNDSLNLKTLFFSDIISDENKFRLFKIDNVGNYYTLNLAKVYIANYKYGIVGEFIVTKENNEWLITNIIGYFPNNNLFLSKFKKAKLE